MIYPGSVVLINIISVSGLARMEGEVIDVEYEDIQNTITTSTNSISSSSNGNNNKNSANKQSENKASTTETKYHLSGIVVHSGQASGGHYYSYILHR